MGRAARAPGVFLPAILFISQALGKRIRMAFMVSWEPSSEAKAAEKPASNHSQLLGPHEPLVVSVLHLYAGERRNNKIRALCAGMKTAAEETIQQRQPLDRKYKYSEIHALSEFCHRN